MREIPFSPDTETFYGPVSRDCGYFWHIERFSAYIPEGKAKTQAFYVFILVCGAEESAIELSELFSFLESKLLCDTVGCEIFTKHSFSHYRCEAVKSMSIYLCCI